jgi:hypothetical protein
MYYIYAVSGNFMGFKIKKKSTLFYRKIISIIFNYHTGDTVIS